MANNIIEKLIFEAMNGGGTYVYFICTRGNIAYISDAGSRKSTRNLSVSENALSEAERTLKRLNDRSILFAGSIKSIHFTLSDGRAGYFERSEVNDFTIIKSRKATESVEKEYSYLRFLSGGPNRIGFAFRVGRKSDYEGKLIACDGSLQAGVFDSGISTDLQFIISTEAFSRSSEKQKRIQKTKKTTILSIDEDLAQEIADSLCTEVLSSLNPKYWDKTFYDILPNSSDKKSELNKIIIDRLSEYFQQRPMCRKDGNHLIGLRGAMLATEEVETIFPQKLIDRIFNSKSVYGDTISEKYWIPVSSRGSRGERFLRDMGVRYYDREQFLLELFKDAYIESFNEILPEMNDIWLRRFYIFCAKPASKQSIRRFTISGFRKSKCLKDTKGKMHFPEDIHIVTDEKSVGGKAVILKSFYIYPNGEADDFSQMIREFLIHEIRVKEYEQQPEIEQLLKSLSEDRHKKDKNYCYKFLTLAQYEKDHSGEIDYSQWPIFPYYHKASKTIRRGAACEIAMGNEYVPQGNTLIRLLNRKPLWDGFKKYLDQNQLVQVLSFVENCGVVGELKVVKQKAELNPLFTKELLVAGKQTAKDSNDDYTIPGLELLLCSRSKVVAGLLWQAIQKAKDSESVLYAEYSSENRINVRRCDSTLIQLLRAKVWVPGKDGKYYKPQDIAIADISDNLSYYRRNPVLKALNFGSALRDKDQRKQNLKKMAASEGYALVPLEEFEKYLQWKNVKNDKY